MTNMARKDTLATPCIFLRERLFWREKVCFIQTQEQSNIRDYMLSFKRLIRKQLCLVLWANVMKWKHSLFELLVHGQDGRVAHKGEGQDGNSIDRLEGGGQTLINRSSINWNPGAHMSKNLPVSCRQSILACMRPRCNPQRLCSGGTGSCSAPCSSFHSEHSRLQAEGNRSRTSW